MVRWHDDYRGEWRLDWRGREASNDVDGFGTEPVATFVLDLENGFKVIHRWPFSLEKFQSGKEKRLSQNDRAQESFEGIAILLDDARRNTRATLARHAALGSRFGLALPHEEIAILEVSGTTATVATTDKSDWATPGQRVVCVWIDDDDATQSISAVIQEVTATTIELDTAPDADAYAIMPVHPVYLDPQQTFARLPTKAETWNLSAHAAIPDFAPARASLALGPITSSPAFDDVFVVSRNFNLTPLSFGLQIYAGDPAGTYTGFPIPTFNFVPDETTLGDLAAALAGSPVVMLAGTYNPADTFAAADVCSGALTGAAAGSVGKGETLTTYAGDGTSRPVWNRRLVVETTAADSVQAMTEIIDPGTIPYALSTADVSDWGRAIKFTSKGWFDWQWLKLFFATTLGPQKAFWLPTWGEDMDFVSRDAGEVTVEVDDFSAWWPSKREYVQFFYSDNSVEYAKVTAATNNGDGTWTLTLDDPDMPSDDPALISWLELCRFESDEFEFVFGDNGVKFQTLARAMVDLGSDRHLREFATISHGTTTHYLSLANRDLLIDGIAYTATSGERGRVGVPSTGNTKDTTITLPIDHTFVKRYLQKGIPPGKIEATITRIDEVNATERIWNGEIDGMNVDDDCTKATFRIISVATKIALRVTPSVVVDRKCPHVLFEGMCGRDLSRDGTNPDGIDYKLTTTVLAVNGRDVRIDLTNVPAANARRAQWCLRGEFIHTASGERRTILDQQDVNPGTGTLTVLTMHVPIVELKVGDSVEVYPGCAHTIAGTHGCGPKFGNRQNLGGFPEMPAGNPFIPGSPSSEAL